MKRLAAVVAPLALALLPVVGAAADEAPPAVVTLRRCLAERSAIDILMLIDESSSLRDSDPDGQRVDGMVAAIDGLVGLAGRTSNDRPIRVSLGLASFSGAYTAVTDGGLADRAGFVPVDGSTRDTLVVLAETFRDRNAGDDTNFEAALQGAVETFAARSASATASGGAPPCKALLFFTDGYLSLGSTRAEERARQRLCDADGLADATRAGDIVTLAVALVGATPPDAANDPQLIERVATGADADGRTCGTTGSPATGLYLPVSDRDQLAEYLRSLVELQPTPPPPVTTPPAPGTCDTSAPCTGTFIVPPYATGFRMRASVPVSGATLALTEPGGIQAAYSGTDPVTNRIGTADLAYRSTSAGGFELTAVTGGTGGTWTWTIVYPTTPGTSASSPTVRLVLDASIEPVLVGPTELTAGVPTDVTFELHADGRSFSAAAGTTLSVVRSDDGSAVPVGAADGSGQWHATLAVPVTTSVNELTLRLEATMPDAGGLAVPVQPGIGRITVLVPGALRLKTTTLQPPAVTGKGTTRAVLEVQAADRTGGCIWVEPGTIVGARRGSIVAQSSRATSAAGCLKVAPGATASLPVDFDVRTVGRGTARGDVVVHLVTDDPAIGERTVKVPASFAQDVPANVWWRVLAIIAAVTGFPLVTLLVLHMMGWSTARFEPRSRSVYWGTDVLVTSSGLRDPYAPDNALSVPDETLLEPVSRDLAKLASYELDGFVLCARPRSPFRPSLRALLDGPFGDVHAKAPRAVTAWVERTKLRSDPKRGRHEIPLALRDCWIFRLDGTNGATESDDAPSGHLGHLVLIVSAVHRTPEQLGRLLDSAADLLPERVVRLVPPTKPDGSSRRGRLRLPSRPRRNPPSTDTPNPFDQLLDDQP